MASKKKLVEHTEEDVTVQEKSNLAEWLESRLHLSLTQFADDMFGNGTVTREERIALSGAIGKALDAYHQDLVINAPQLFQRSQWEEAPVPIPGSSPVSSAEIGEGSNVELAGDYMPLVEKAVKRDGTVPIKIIQPGWGSSGYYPAEVLMRDGPALFTKDTKMYWNHQTAAEEAERPEGDLNNLAAVLASDARYLEQGPKGPGLYADAKVFENYQQPLDSIAPHIGVSIRAHGKAVQGMAEGKSGPIISAITARRSVDFVTEPGAGGEVITMFEAARGNADGGLPNAECAKKAAEAAKSNLKEVDMTEEELKKLQETNAAYEKENARLREALIVREVKDVAGAVLAKSTLPKVTKTRLIESLAKAAPVKEGALDVGAFTAQISEAVRNETEYLVKATGMGNIQGLGESASDDDDRTDERKIQESLEESFGALGLSETAAKVAAKGR